jgi:putative ABC transport system substrate-binding protein
MRRREFVAGMVGAAAWPLPTKAQQPSMPVIGFINSQSPEPFAHLSVAFVRGLREIGFSDGQNVTIEFRWAEGHYERLPELTADLIRRGVAVLAATGGEPVVLAVKAVTSTIPVVFVIGGDPVSAGFVDSLNRPGGNMTGITQFTLSLEAKRLGLARDLVPVAPIGALFNPTFSPTEKLVKDVTEAAAQENIRLVLAFAKEEAEFEPAIKALVENGARTITVAADPFFNSRRAQLAALIASYRLPSVFEFREFVEAGGLMSYGTNIGDAYRQAGSYAGRILNREKPGDLPVIQATKPEFVINLKTARALDLTIPPPLLARADEVIE